MARDEKTKRGRITRSELERLLHEETLQDRLLALVPEAEEIGVRSAKQ